MNVRKLDIKIKIYWKLDIKIEIYWKLDINIKIYRFSRGSLAQEKLLRLWPYVSIPTSTYTIYEQKKWIFRIRLCKCCHVQQYSHMCFMYRLWTAVTERRWLPSFSGKRTRRRTLRSLSRQHSAPRWWLWRVGATESHTRTRCVIWSMNSDQDSRVVHTEYTAARVDEAYWLSILSKTTVLVSEKANDEHEILSWFWDTYIDIYISCLSRWV